MTDLKPEDLFAKMAEIAEAYDDALGDNGHCGEGSFEFKQRKAHLAATERRYREAFPPHVAIALLADRARMEKALRDLAENMPLQVEATRGYLIQNGLDAHFADVLLSHYLDFAREAGEAVGASQ